MSIHNPDDKMRDRVRDFVRRLETVEPVKSYFLTRIRLGLLTLHAGMLTTEFARAVKGGKDVLNRALEVNYLYNQWGYMLTLIDQIKGKNLKNTCVSGAGGHAPLDAVSVASQAVLEKGGFERDKLMAYAEDLQNLGISEAGEFINRILSPEFPNNLDKDFLNQFRESLKSEAMDLRQSVEQLAGNEATPAPA